MAKQKSTNVKLSNHVALLRIVFGFMWAIDASFKWHAAFKNSFLVQIKSAADGQPSWLHGWFNSWIKLISHSPHDWAILVAVIETLIAIALILGFARKTTYILAAIFSLLIWSIAEGFGGPYTAASTDIGTGIIYAVVFFSLYGLDKLSSQSSWSVDKFISKRISWWGKIANP